MYDILSIEQRRYRERQKLLELILFAASGLTQDPVDRKRGQRVWANLNRGSLEANRHVGR
jgi:hypothetical protein